MQTLDAGEITKAEEASRNAWTQKNGESRGRISSEEKAKDDAKRRGQSKEEDAGTPKMPVDPGYQRQRLISNVWIISLELRAGLLMANKPGVEARRLHRSSGTGRESLGLCEPTGYIRPVAETEPQAMLKATAWTDAKTAYEKALVDRPDSGFALTAWP